VERRCCFPCADQTRPGSPLARPSRLRAPAPHARCFPVTVPICADPLEHLPRATACAQVKVPVGLGASRPRAAVDPGTAEGLLGERIYPGWAGHSVGPCRRMCVAISCVGVGALRGRLHDSSSRADVLAPSLPSCVFHWSSRLFVPHTRHTSSMAGDAFAVKNVFAWIENGHDAAGRDAGVPC